MWRPRGSLSAAPLRLEDVTPAIIGRRLDALEARLGVKLMIRTTRKLTLTFEGQAFLEDCQRVLNDLANAEAAVLGGVQASGQLRVSAPAAAAATWRLLWSGNSWRRTRR